eukprot:14708736-Heterocapsa_arctica.AAC.1
MQAATKGARERPRVATNGHGVARQGYLLWLWQAPVGWCSACRSSGPFRSLGPAQASLRSP